MTSFAVTVPQPVHETAPTGLTTAQVEALTADGKVNKAVRRTGRTTGEIIRTNVFTRINAILGVLLVIVLSTGSVINAAFGLLIIANSAIGIIQELRAKRTLEKLTVLGESKPRVIRDGVRREIIRDNIVLGDLIDVGAGDQLVVDGIVTDAHGLSVDESMLTGESNAVHKKVGDQVLSGSFVTCGSMVYQATAIGEDAYSAKLVAEAGRFTLTDSQLQDGINTILKFITWLLIPTGLLTIWTQLGRTGAPWKDAVLSMVAALVPMVPEGLVLMTSIAFAVGVVRLGKRKALVNELPAIEGLARVDTVCTDKTGTLTEGTMTVDSIIALDESSVSEEKVRAVLAAMAAADDHKNETMQAIAHDLGEDLLSRADAVSDTVEFDSARKWSGVTVATTGRSWVLGAPDVLADAGSVARQRADACGSQGLRVLFVGAVTRGQDLSAVTATPATPGGDTIEPAGLVVLKQTVRDDAADTLRYFADEKVTVKVISGDNALSVGAVAASLGIDAGDDGAIDARTLPEGGSEKFVSAVEAGTVFGRVTPNQKRDMVVALKKAGHGVAMTGDGVNDVLALKEASIGVAMGSGSPATRSVAQVVLLDNKFATLPHVVAEGRRVIGNIERVANLFLTKTVYSVVLALVVGIWGITFPFQPIHVTMVGWFTIGIPAFILSLAPNHERARPGFVGRVLRLALPSGLAIGLFTVVFWIIHNPGIEASSVARQQAGTATLAVTLIMALWVLVVVARPYRWWKIALLAVSAGAYVVLYGVPFTQHLLLLDAKNHVLLAEGCMWGVIGAVFIEVFWWSGHRLTKTAVVLWDRQDERGLRNESV